MRPDITTDFLFQPDIMFSMWKSVSVPVIIVRMDDLIVLEANPQAKNLFSNVCPDLTGKRLDSLQLWPDDQKSKAFLRKLADTPKIENYELNLHVEQESSGDFLINTDTMEIAGITYRLIMMRDITERKNLEQAMMGKILESAERERNELVATLHDDIGADLSTIRLLLSSLNQLVLNNYPFKPRLVQCLTYLDNVIMKIKIITADISPDEISRFGLETSLGALIFKLTL